VLLETTGYRRADSRGEADEVGLTPGYALLSGGTRSTRSVARGATGPDSWYRIGLQYRY
jgi:hypothetical protein